MAALTPPPSIKYLNTDTRERAHTDGFYKSESDARKTFMFKGKIYHNLIMY